MIFEQGNSYNKNCPDVDWTGSTRLPSNSYTLRQLEGSRGSFSKIQIITRNQHLCDWRFVQENQRASKWAQQVYERGMCFFWSKVEKILKSRLDSIPSPLTFSENLKLWVGKYAWGLRCKGKTLLVDVNKLFVFKSLLTMPSNVLSLHLK